MDDIVKGIRGCFYIDDTPKGMQITFNEKLCGQLIEEEKERTRYIAKREYEEALKKHTDTFKETLKDMVNRGFEEK